jgi:hypothetical protein
MEAAGLGPLHWMVWRVAVSQHIKDSYHIIMDEWSMYDLVDAHAVLDALEALTPPPPRIKAPRR